MKLDNFTLAYIEAALWSSTDDAGEPLDNGEHELAEETRAKMIADCERFQFENAADLAEENRSQRRAQGECSVEESAGHDFWLTRNGHGCGFWDGDWPKEQGEYLSKRAKELGGCWPYKGDDGQIYFG